MATGEGAMLPEYPADRLAILTPDALIELLVAEGDRAPRSLIDECANRGEEMVDALARLAEDDAVWADEVDNGRWWLRLHAAMILGLIPGERAGAVLVSLMRRMELADDSALQDWLAGYWPALFRNKPDTVLPALRALAQDRGVDWYLRAPALECVLAASASAGSAELETALDWIGRFAADESEDWDFRLCAGNDLLDFPRERHRALLDALAAQQRKPFVTFSSEDVVDAYRAGVDARDWQGRDDPWSFYRPEEIAARQERWAREAAGETGADDEGEGGLDEIPVPYVRARAKIGRNDPCPCGSGKKYKKCCLGKDEG